MKLDGIPSFRAEVASEITRHRQNNGDCNTIDHFARDVSAHRTRYGLKLDAMRYDHPDVRADEVIE
jgi:hypothetical protein